MKKTLKQLFASVIALAMICSMVTAFATNTVVIESIEVLKEGEENPVVTFAATADNIALKQDQLLKVTLHLEGGDPAAILESGDITFLSYKDGTEPSALADGTIQYIDQGSVATAEGNKVVVTFRPRVTLGTGTFEAKAGGTEAAVETFDYEVTNADVNMTVSGGATFYDEQEEDVVFTTNVPNDGSISAVKIGGVALVPETDYTLDKTGEYIKVTVLQAKVDDLAVGTHTVTISADGFVDGTGTIKINEQEYVVPDDNKDEAQAGLDSALNDALQTDIAPVDGSFTVSGLNNVTVSVGGEEKSVEFTLDTTASTPGVALDEDGNLTYTPEEGVSPFVGKAKIEAKVGTNVSIVKDVYFIPADTKIGFGNVTALDNNLADAFKPTGSDDEKKAAFADFLTANEAAIKTADDLALAVAAGRAETDTIAQATETLSFNGDNVITLNEYNIYRKMVGGFTGFDIVTVTRERAERYGK